MYNPSDKPSIAEQILSSSMSENIKRPFQERLNIINNFPGHLKEKINGLNQTKASIEALIYSLGKSPLPEKLIILFISTLQWLVDKNIEINNFFSGYNLNSIIGKCEALYNDLINIEVKDDVYKALFYSTLAPFCDIRRLGKDHDKVYLYLIINTFFDTSFRKAIINSKTRHSGYISFMQVVAPHIDELEQAISKNQRFLVLKINQKIINLCNQQGIVADLDVNDLSLELKKRYHELHYMCKEGAYEKAITNLTYNNANAFLQAQNINKNYPLVFMYADNCYTEAIYLQVHLYRRMLEYYKQTGCMFRQLEGDINLYRFDNLVDNEKPIIVIAYNADDIPDMQLVKKTFQNEKSSTLTWQDRNFWLKMFDVNTKFEQIKGINYLVDSNSDIYRINSKRFSEKEFDILKSWGTVIVAPEEYMEEALYHHLTKGNAPEYLDLNRLSQLEQNGLQLDNLTQKLIYGGNGFYLKNPTLVDDLRVRKLSDFPILDKIYNKKNPKERSRTIRAFKNAEKRSQNNKSELSVEPTPPISYKYRLSSDKPKYWWEKYD